MIKTLVLLQLNRIIQVITEVLLGNQWFNLLKEIETEVEITNQHAKPKMFRN